jgi:hypothetical protein
MRSQVIAAAFAAVAGRAKHAARQPLAGAKEARKQALCTLPYKLHLVRKTGGHRHRHGRAHELADLLGCRGAQSTVQQWAAQSPPAGEQGGFDGAGDAVGFPDFPGNAVNLSDRAVKLTRHAQPLTFQVR